jgi:sulfate adenylyltransferase
VTDNRGVCIWLTGRSGAGKTTVTDELVPMLTRRGRAATVLDVVPELAKHWSERSSEGKLIRKAFVAHEVSRHGGIAICVTVSARADVRARARALVGPDRFLELYFDTPPDVSASRKASRTKRPPLVKRIRRNLRKVRRLGRPPSSYQVPEMPDLVLDTTHTSPGDNALAILDLLETRGFLSHREVDAARGGDEASAAAAETHDELDDVADEEPA